MFNGEWGMALPIEELQSKALSLLREACSSYGILASPSEQENYRRLWARDAMVAGLAGLLTRDPVLLDGMKSSIRTLADHQHPRGMIPSNVLPASNGKEPEISYGGLAGRVDATAWFLVGACLYMQHYKGQVEAFKRSLQPHLLQALEILDRWEFNAKGLLYTPLSGNWADEYPVQGHTLYDNCLRLWGVELYAALYKDERRAEQGRMIRERIAINFWPRMEFADHPAVYHRRTFRENAREDARHFACSIDPRGYSWPFDAAGHALTLLLGLPDEEQLESITAYVEDIFLQIEADMLPAFWPVIRPGDPEWFSLEENYSFDFKNKPHHFHNGGIWPVWMGLFAYGLKSSGDNADGNGSRNDLAGRMLKAWMEVEDAENPGFYEYIASDTFQPSGKHPLSYSASGMIFLIQAIGDHN